MVEARSVSDARSMVRHVLSRNSRVSTASIKSFKLLGLFGETCQSFLNRESAISTIIPQRVTISIELSQHIAEVRLHRLPFLVREGLARELAYTARPVDAGEAPGCGLVNRVFDNPDELHEGVREIALRIAGKSPLAIRGIKEMPNYGRNHSVGDGLNYVATWNAAMLMSVDLAESMRALREQRMSEFDD